MRRRRRCEECGHAWFTVEILDAPIERVAVPKRHRALYHSLYRQNRRKGWSAETARARALKSIPTSELTIDTARPGDTS